MHDVVKRVPEKSGTLNLKDVTLVMIDRHCPELAKLALDDSLALAEFGQVLVVSPEHNINPPVKHDWLKRELNSIDEFCCFVWYELPEHISPKITHILKIEWDGWIIDPTMWSDEFLQYDYVGAPWGWHADGMNVGNGCGLRSLKLMDFLADHRDEFPLKPGDLEDDLLCRKYRPELEKRGFKWAPDHIASRFAFECSRPSENSKHLMFHELRNFPLVLEGERLKKRLDFVHDNVHISELKLHDLEACLKPRIIESLGAPAIDQKADRALQLVALGEERRAAGDFGNARALLLGAVDADNDCWKAYHNLGTMVNSDDRYNVSIALFEKALEINPQSGMTWLSLGNAYWRQRRYDDAFEVLSVAEKMVPDHPGLHHNLGLWHYTVGKPKKAIHHLRRAIELEDSVGKRSDLGLAILKSGDLLEGFKTSEARWEGMLKKNPVWDCDLPRWNGEPNCRLLLHHEQGFGDTLQFIRFAKSIKEQYDIRVTFAAPNALVRLLEFNAAELGIDEVIDIESPAAIVKAAMKADYHCPLISALPILGVTYGTLPKATPYLRALRPSPRSVRRSNFSIGLIWAASPGYERSRQRSVPITDLLELGTIKNVQLYSLQIGPFAKDLYESGADYMIKDATAGIKDFADTAEAMNNIELIISVDSGPVHLAGALGIPTFMLNPIAPCWRWTNGAEPWYRDMRLFNQETVENWHAPIAKMKGAVIEMMRRR